MLRKLVAVLAVVLVAVLAAVPASAETLGFRGWGPRVGVSDGPDQIFGGVHFDLGEFTRHVRLQPSVDLGFGNDVTTLTGNFMVGYYFDVNGRIDPYAGGQLSVAYYDIDRGGSETEIAPAAVGGFEMPLAQQGNRFLVEMQLGFGDIPDVKILAGWTFR